MKYIISSLLLFAIACGGCASTDKDAILRSGLADLDVGNYRAAHKAAEKILSDWSGDHAAQLLKAEAAAKAGDIKQAVNVIVHADRACKADLCTNESRHISLLLLLNSLTSNEETLKRAQEKIAALQRKIAVQQHASLVDFYTKQGQPRAASAAFDKLMEASNGELNSDQRLFGYLLYDSVFESEKAKKLYDQLSPQQKALIQTKGSD